LMSPVQRLLPSLACVADLCTWRSSAVAAYLGSRRRLPTSPDAQSTWASTSEAIAAFLARGVDARLVAHSRCSRRWRQVDKLDGSLRLILYYLQEVGV
jgi:hypothetical protein